MRHIAGVRLVGLGDFDVDLIDLAVYRDPEFHQRLLYDRTGLRSILARSVSEGPR
jgi:hypothetical protein